MTGRPYTPLELSLPESGPIQGGAKILADVSFNTDRIPLPLFELETESQSSFDPRAQVLNISASNDSLPPMEDGEETIEFTSDQFDLSTQKPRQSGVAMCARTAPKQCGTDLLLEFQEEPQLCADLASCHNATDCFCWKSV